MPATVTLRQALAHSLNIPAVKVAEMVGYDKVGDYRARRAAESAISSRRPPSRWAPMK